MNGGGCRFKSETRLPVTLKCDGKECDVDTAVLVKLRGAGTRLNGAPFDVFYEYIREPCVALSYFDNPVQIRPGRFPTYGSIKPMCANPKAAVAAIGCCANTTRRQRGQALSAYSDEAVTRATAEARCKALTSTFEPCAKQAEPGKSSRCFCRGGQARFGNDHFYASNWSKPVAVPDSLECTPDNFYYRHDPGFLDGGNDGRARGLLACKGECDGDHQCAEGLKCFERTKGERVPGCWGTGASPTWDYCYDPLSPPRSPPPPPPRVVGAMCQCKLPDTASYSLCDMTQPTVTVTASTAAGVEKINRHFWTADAPTPCQMQAQVSRDGLVTMVDNIEGPTATLAGTATQSSVLGSFKADRATDGYQYTYTSTQKLPNAWWQLDLGARRAVGSITIQNRAGSCASKWFEDNTGCRWEHRKDTEKTPIVGFKVGVSNTSCLSGGRGCGGVVCAHVKTPTTDHIHEYTIACDPPVVGQYAYVFLPGDNRVLSIVEAGVRAIISTQRTMRDTPAGHTAAATLRAPSAAASARAWCVLAPNEG